MSEMLGNQYFMARNYSDAMRELEEVLIKHPSNKNVKKKLIVCYTQTGKVNKALDFFYELIKEDIEFIINTNPVHDDCPCPELVQLIEKKKVGNVTSPYFNIISGIIWLYCDPNKSLEYFIKSLGIEPNNQNIKNITQIIKNYIHSRPTKQNISKTNQLLQNNR